MSPWPVSIHETHEEREEVPFPTRNDLAAPVRTAAIAFAEFTVQTEQEALFAALWAALHPLALSHQSRLFVDIGDMRRLGFLLHFYHFFTPVL